MKEDKTTIETFDPKAAVIFGILLGSSGIFCFGGIYLLVSIFDFNLTKFINGMGIVALYCSFLLFLGPVFGALLAVGSKSWNIFKIWLTASSVGIIINAIMAAILLNIT